MKSSCQVTLQVKPSGFLIDRTNKEFVLKVLSVNGLLLPPPNHRGKGAYWDLPLELPVARSETEDRAVIYISTTSVTYTERTHYTDAVMLLLC